MEERISEKIDCTIKVISPVHIGSEKSYGSSEYVFSKAKTKSGNIIGLIKRINVDKYFSNLSENKKDEFIEGLTDSSFKLNDYDSKISNSLVRYKSINKCKNNPNEIQEHIKTMDELYIPGSSLKGAIKTVLLSEAVNSSDISEIKDFIYNRNGRFQINYRDYNNFLDSFFSGKLRNSAQASVMRFLKVSDSDSVKIPSIYDVITLKTKESEGIEYHKVHNNIAYSFLETIERGKILKCTFNIDFDYNIYKKLQIDSIKQKNLDINYIKRSLYKFAREFIDYERYFADEYEIGFLQKFYKNLEDQNSPEEPLLKIGAGSGFMATTIGMKIKEHDPRTYDLVRKTFRRSYDYEFPKSRKIIANGGYPLGWVKLKFE